MAFDANLMLCDGSADWSHVNLVTSHQYGTPTSTTRNDGGFAVIDLGSANIGAAVGGLAVVLVLSEAAAATDDELTVTIEECAAEGFGSATHELGKFDIAAATTGVILGSEVPATVIMRVSPKLRYLRIKAVTSAVADDFGVCYALLSPYPYKVL